MTMTQQQSYGWLRRICRFFSRKGITLLDDLFPFVLPVWKRVRGVDQRIRSGLLYFLATYPPTSWIAQSEWWQRVGPGHYGATWRTVREIIFRVSYLGIYSGCTRLAIAWQAGDMNSISDFGYLQPLIWGGMALFEFLFILAGDAESGSRTRLWLPRTRAEREEALRAALLTLGTTPLNTVVGLYVLDYHKRSDAWAQGMEITLFAVILINIINVIRTKWEQDDDYWAKSRKQATADLVMAGELQLQVVDLPAHLQQVLAGAGQSIPREVVQNHLTDLQKLNDQLTALIRRLERDIQAHQAANESEAA